MTDVDLHIAYLGRTTDLLYERLRSEGFAVKATEAVAFCQSSARVAVLGEGVEATPDLLDCVRTGRSLVVPLRTALSHVAHGAGIRLNSLGQFDLRWRFHRGHDHPAPTLPVYRYGQGFLLTYPDGVERLLGDDTVAPVTFLACGPDGAGRSLIWERFAATAKPLLIRYMRRLIFEAARACQVPVLRMGHAPFGKRAIFNYRFDCDGSRGYGGDVPAHFEIVLESCRDFAHCVNWFVTVRDYLPHAGTILAAYEAGMEVGSHGTIHAVFARRYVQRENLAIADEFLRRLGPVTGYTSPAGIYSRATSEFLVERGIAFSGDLGFDYDGLPYRMYDTKQDGGVWQFPAHPICLGCFLDPAGEIRESAVLGYYEALREYRARLREPAVIYCHPENRLGKHPKVFRTILLMFADDSRFWPVTHARYLEWFRRTRALEVCASWDPARRCIQGTVEEPLPEPAVSLEVWWPDGTFQAEEARPRFQVGQGTGREALQWGLESPGVGDPFMDDREAVPAMWTPRRTVKGCIRKFLPMEDRVYLTSLRAIRKSLLHV